MTGTICFRKKGTAKLSWRKEPRCSWQCYLWPIRKNKWKFSPEYFQPSKNVDSQHILHLQRHLGSLQTNPDLAWWPGFKKASLSALFRKSTCFPVRRSSYSSEASRGRTPRPSPIDPRDKRVILLKDSSRRFVRWGALWQETQLRGADEPEKNSSCWLPSLPPSFAPVTYLPPGHLPDRLEVNIGIHWHYRATGVRV